ncbi:IS66-like element accessory protein TnpA [Segnochrobactrum spirostomi]|uniref:Transposase n=1 Tax=Segnochrobactrum spirostomi TaxID=2608987 RepID=A0A6A7Y8T5_9HYPH|nr:transposase [Segnochrobactrum spirostomi]MQT15286.1 transposase [Segnochrobactrum spirostomi]
MGRVEILTGRDRRRGWSDEQKLAILEEVATSGLRISEVARRHDVIPQQIYGWRRQFLAKVREERPAEAARLLPVSLVAAELPKPEAPKAEGALVKEMSVRPMRGVRIEVRCKGGRSLFVDAGIDRKRRPGGTFIGLA